MKLKQMSVEFYFHPPRQRNKNYVAISIIVNGGAYPRIIRKASSGRFHLLGFSSMAPTPKRRLRFFRQQIYAGRSLAEIKKFILREEYVRD